jgi:membrane protein involved in colicin uptake
MSGGDLAEFMRLLHEAQLKQMEAEAKTKEVEDQAKEDKAKAQLKQLETEAKTKVAEDQAKVAEAKRQDAEDAAKEAEAKRKRTAAALEEAETDLEGLQKRESNRQVRLAAEKRRPGNSGNASTPNEVYQWGKSRTVNLDCSATRRRNKGGAGARAEAKADKRLQQLQEEKNHLSGVLRKAQQGARNDVFNSTLDLLQSPIGGLLQQYLTQATRHAQAFHTTGGTADPNIPCKYTRMLFDVMQKYGVDFVHDAVDNAVGAHKGAASTGAAGGSPPAGGSGGSASGWGR